jgi:NADH dehydrogenase FAD-containing subunit
VQRRVRRQLRRRGITVLRENCTGVAPGHVQLGSGATLACDVPLVAIGTHAPPWLQGSGLDLSESGHVQVNAHQQSTSHPNVFAAGDAASRADAPHPKSGVYAVRAGPPLAHNLLATLTSQPLKPHHPPRHTLNLLSCGTRHAIASYGQLHAEGAWVWWWKDRIDRGFVARYSKS